MTKTKIRLPGLVEIATVGTGSRGKRHVVYLLAPDGNLARVLGDVSRCDTGTWSARPEGEDWLWEPIADPLHSAPYRRYFWPTKAEAASALVRHILLKK